MRRWALPIGCIAASLVLVYAGHRFDTVTNPAMSQEQMWRAMPPLIKLAVVGAYLLFVVGLSIALLEILASIKRHRSPRR